MRLTAFLSLSCGAALIACAPAAEDAAQAAIPSAAENAASDLIDNAQLLEDLRILAADDMAGRAVATPGNAQARAYLIGRFEAIGLPPLGESYEHAFDFRMRADDEAAITGVNLIGRVEGASDSDRIMVVTAHYDHVGEREGEIYNGADDNGSGTAALLAVAEAFIAEPPLHDTLFVLFDAEEVGLRGARAFVDNPPVDIADIAFNLNFDMVAYSEQNNLWAVGTYHYPALIPAVEAADARTSVNMPMGFDEPSEDPGADWTLLSDHGPFHMAGIPFIYLGVDYHPHYHQPTDTFENMTLDFFQEAAAATLIFAREADARLDAIGESAGR